MAGLVTTMSDENFRKSAKQLREYCEYFNSHEMTILSANQFNKENLDNLIKKYSTIENNLIRQNLDKLIKEYEEDNKEKEEKKKKIKEDKRQNSYWFITISPNNKCEIEDLDKIMNAIKEKIWIKNNNIIYVYEQRGTTIKTMGTGKHIHMLINKNKKKSRGDKRDNKHNKTIL